MSRILQIAYAINLLYPLLQAFGMVFLKDSADPLQKISKLDLIIMYSKTQKKLSSFKEVMVQGLEFQELNNSQQALMLEELERRSDSCPLTITTQPSMIVGDAEI